jgi:hypothetical protein
MFKKIFFIVILFIANTTMTIAQCAMCRASVGSNLSEGKGVIGSGINDGILYLLSVPYIAIGTMIYIWYRSAKKNRVVNA